MKKHLINLESFNKLLFNSTNMINIFKYAEKIVNIPSDEEKSNKYKDISREYRNIIYISAYIYKKYWIERIFEKNKENKKLPDFYFGYNLEEFPIWDYELTEVYNHEKEIFNNEDFFHMFEKCIQKKSSKNYRHNWILWLIIHSNNISLSWLNKKDIIQYLYENRENYKFDIVIYLTYIWDNKEFITLYNKNKNTWNIIIIEDIKNDIKILEDSKFDLNKLN